MNLFQALEVESEEFVDNLLGSLAIHSGIRKIPKIDQSSMRKELEEAIGNISQISEGSIQPAEEVINSLPSECAAVMGVFSEVGEGLVSAVDIASTLEITETAATYYLDELEKMEFLGCTLVIG